MLGLLGPEVLGCWCFDWSLQAAGQLAQPCKPAGVVIEGLAQSPALTAGVLVDATYLTRPADAGDRAAQAAENLASRAAHAS